MARIRVPLTWGQGLDRSTGLLAEDSASFLDLRNLLVRESKLIARHGLVAVEATMPGCTDCVGGFPYRTIKGSILVGYNRNTRLLSIWRIDGQGGSAVRIGDWETLPSGAPLPIIAGAESFNKFFLAHDEPLYNYRARTVYYDQALSPGSQIVDLTSDLDGDATAEQIRFRGVYAWLSYLAGWGYGTAVDENRPETVRLSDPGAPLVFSQESYFLAGVLGEPVTGLLVNGRRLRVQKMGSANQILGTGTADFGIEDLEALYGQLNSRLGVQVGDQGLFWGEQGPRIAAGGPSTDIGVPLELDGPEPGDLTPAGPAAYGWSVYLATERVVLFGFPALSPAGDITRCYALSLRTPGVIKWSYFEIAQAIYCAWLVTEGAETSGSVPTGYADTVVGADGGLVGTGREADFTWDAHALIGGEVAEIFVKPDGGAWELKGTGLAADEAVTLPGFKALLHYIFAIRFTKDGLAASGYESADPDDWTADTAPDAKGDFTTSCTPPAALTVAWSRTSSTAHKVTANFTLAELDLGIRLYQSDDGTSGWAEVEEAALPYDTRTLDHVVADALLATTKYFRVTAFRGALESTPSLAVSRYIGPTTAPVKLALVQKGTIAEIEIWMQAVGSGSTKLNVETSDDGSTGWASVFSSGTYARKQALTGHEITLADTVHVRARFLTTAFGVDDAGPWVAFGSIFVDNSAAPSVPANEDGVWAEAPSAVQMTFDDPGAGLGTFAEFQDGATTVAVSPVVDSPTAVINLTTVRDLGGSYSPLNYADVAPVQTITLYTVNRAGGRFKVSVGVDVVVTMTMAGPTNVVPGTAGAGLLQVEWDNGTYGTDTYVAWWPVSALSGFGSLLGPPVTMSGVDDTIIGPAGGYPALPADGQDIKVRVLHHVGGGSPRFSDYVDEDWTVGT